MRWLAGGKGTSFRKDGRSSRQLQCAYERVSKCGLAAPSAGVCVFPGLAMEPLRHTGKLPVLCLTHRRLVAQPFGNKQCLWCSFCFAEVACEHSMHASMAGLAHKSWSGLALECEWDKWHRLAIAGWCVNLCCKHAYLPGSLLCSAPR